MPLLSYIEARNSTDIPLFKVRREKLCEQFFDKNMNNDKLSLINKASFDYNMRPSCKYSSYLCTTERIRKLFLPQIIVKKNSE